jgi:hypothetical protein
VPEERRIEEIGWWMEESGERGGVEGKAERGWGADDCDW